MGSKRKKMGWGGDTVKREATGESLTPIMGFIGQLKFLVALAGHRTRIGQPCPHQANMV
jgi:hypothetical protein